jgi:hypothetical protein
MAHRWMKKALWLLAATEIVWVSVCDVKDDEGFP